jgi:tetratricopeptide (TPR) repeat protein
MLPGTTERLNQLLALALGHFRAGRLGESEAAWRQVLALAPTHAGASYNLAVTLRAQGRLEDAAAQYRRTLQIQPGNAKAHNNLGVILGLQGKTQEAGDHYARALRIQPDYAEAHYNLGNVLRERGDNLRAVDHYRRALAARPDDPEIHNNLGVALAAAGRGDEAVGAYRRALSLRPDYAEACSNLGAALVDLGRMDEAMAQYARALQLRPDYADARFNLAHAFDVQDRTDEAHAQYELALALDPTHAEAHHNFGFLAQRLGRLDEALARYQRAQRLKPGYADAEGNEGLARLVMGDFETGWDRYEARWDRPGNQRRTLPAPAWDGGDLAGKTILLHAEQGLGDAIQFVRYAALVKARGATVVFECAPSQERLFQGVAGIDRLVPAGRPLPPFDCHAPLLGLARLLKTRLESIPADVPYLKAEPELAAAWRERLSGLARPRIGFLWRGTPKHPNHRRRSMPAAAMAGLVAGQEAGWVCLQLDPREDELAALPPIYQAGPELGDWADTAALVDGLDLVITVDTSITHLAGALGKPVWMLIPFAPDWRWLLDRADSPWYPTMRLFRQPAPGAWEPVLQQVADALKSFPDPAPLAPLPPPPARPRRLPPAMVVSHERSGTHFLMNALSYAYGYTASPWTDLDRHEIDIDYSSPSQIAEALEARAGDPLMRLVKSHHAAGVFAEELSRITRSYTVYYVYREPATVMVSLWRHLNGLAWNEGPKLPDPLALAKAAPSGRLTRYQAGPHPTMLQRWAAHVEGWLMAAAADPRIVPVRYEDLDSRYPPTVAALAEAAGRAPLQPMLRPPRDVNVIAMGKTAAEAPVTPAAWADLKAYCRREAGPLMQRLGY